MTRKCLHKMKNKKGETYAFIDNGDNTFSILTIIGNYDGRVKGGIRYKWVTLNKAMRVDRNQAAKIYNSKFSRNYI